jgi:hypothetical protein
MVMVNPLQIFLIKPISHASQSDMPVLIADETSNFENVQILFDFYQIFNVMDRLPITGHMLSEDIKVFS